MNVPVIDLLATGKNIKQHIKEHDFNAPIVAKRLGVSNTTVYKWCSGEHVPTVDNLVILSSMFGVKIDDLIVVRK